MANIRFNRNAFPLSLQPRTADPGERKKGERKRERKRERFDIAIWPLTAARPAFGARCTTNVNRKATRVHRVDKGVTRAGTIEQSRGTFIIIICSPCVSTCKPNARLVYFLSFPPPSFFSNPLSVPLTAHERNPLLSTASRCTLLRATLFSFFFFLFLYIYCGGPAASTYVHITRRVTRHKNACAYIRSKRGERRGKRAFDSFVERVLRLVYGARGKRVKLSD